MRNYVDELTMATSIIKQACDRCLLGVYDKNEDSLSGSFDLQEQIINGLKNTFEGDVVVTQMTRNESFASHRTWTIDVGHANERILRKSKYFGIQVSLVEAKDIVLSIIYLPFVDETYTATLGGGAYLNGTQINIQPVKLNDSIIGFGEFNKADPESNALQVEMIKNIRNDVSEVVMMGSNALNFSYVASGKINGLVYFSNNICAINPGILLCQEAGAFVSNVEGSEYKYENNNIVIADTAELIAGIKQSTTSPLSKGNQMDDKIRIGYVGIQGDLCEKAANDLANRQNYRFVDFIPCVDAKQIIRDLQIRKIDYAVVPTSTGHNAAYREVSEQLARIRFEVVDSCTCPLELNLYKRTKDISNGSITRIVSDENYFYYANNSLRLLLPNAERVNHSVASVAAKNLRDDKYNDYTGVICTPQSGEFNRLALVKEGLVVPSGDTFINFRLIKYTG